MPVEVMTGESLTESQSTGTFAFPVEVLFDIAPLESYGTFVSPVERVESYSYTISGDYRGVVMNLPNQAISTYSNYPFNSLAYFNGKYLGASGAGIYVLSGVDDNGVDISAHIKTGPMDFGHKQVKHIRDVWMTHRTDGHLALVFLVDEDNTVMVERQTVLVNPNELQEEKVKVPRGLKGRYYTIELKNLSGADFDIDALEIMADVIGGKKR